eukprot:TRINITY_DN8195_c0_g1_i1.p1 TRINITY_DN8195_c0_g1~~TRINITY_DN8195_c0_g1_i1.p1  ORF type:complete len:447 (+),score=80.93 TRINITY_DN8195_c0_g1_i1:84-1424(+)
MKVNVIKRDPDAWVRETKNQLPILNRNLDPALHPFERAREYVRATNAAKIERIFAKPFVMALNEHKEGVYKMRRHPKHLATVVTGAADGEIKTWNLSTRRCTGTLKAHEKFVNGLAVSINHVISVGDDKILVSNLQDDMNLSPKNNLQDPEGTSFTAVDWQRSDSDSSLIFATGGLDKLHLWDASLAQPLQSYAWGAESILCVKFNLIERSQLCATFNDRTVAFYDTRANTPVSKLVLKMNSNSASWNPMEPFSITMANDDYNLYTFDVRNLSTAVTVHTGFLGAVMDVDFSPTGKEFVAGSYDKTVRIFQNTYKNSREVYYTKRMQKTFCVQVSGDAQFLLSGSEDGNIRVWKMDASRPLRAMAQSEHEKIDYNKALIDRYSEFPEVKKLAKKRKLPRALFAKQRTFGVMRMKRRRKEESIKAHTKSSDVQEVPEKQKAIVKTLD